MPPPLRWDRQVVILTPTVADDPDTGNPRETWPAADPPPVDALRGDPAAGAEDREDPADGQTTAEETWAFPAGTTITSRSRVKDGAALYRVVGRPVEARSYLTGAASHIEARLLFISDLQEAP